MPLFETFATLLSTQAFAHVTAVNSSAARAGDIQINKRGSIRACINQCRTITPAKGQSRSVALSQCHHTCFKTSSPVLFKDSLSTSPKPAKTSSAKPAAKATSVKPASPVKAPRKSSCKVSCAEKRASANRALKSLKRSISRTQKTARKAARRSVSIAEKAAKQALSIARKLPARTCVSPAVKKAKSSSKSKPKAKPASPAPQKPGPSRVSVPVSPQPAKSCRQQCASRPASQRLSCKRACQLKLASDRRIRRAAIARCSTSCSHARPTKGQTPQQAVKACMASCKSSIKPAGSKLTPTDRFRRSLDKFSKSVGAKLRSLAQQLARHDAKPRPKSASPAPAPAAPIVLMAPAPAPSPCHKPTAPLPASRRDRFLALVAATIAKNGL